MRILQGLGIIVFLLSIISCDLFQQAYRGADSEEIVIGVAGPWLELAQKNSHLLDGITMAVDEINAEGGILNKQIRMVRKDDKQSVDLGRLIAKDFADDPSMIAVIGHVDSYVTRATSATYEFSGMLMLSPTSTDPVISEQEFKYIFRNIPTDEEIGVQIAEFAKTQGHKRMLIYYVKTEYGRKMANTFEKRAEELDIFIVDRLSYTDVTERNFRRVLNGWKDREFDAIMLIGSLPQAAAFVKQVRQIGIKSAIIGSNALDEQELIDLSGENSEGMIVASTFHSENPRPSVKAFSEAFSKKYQIQPDSWAAQGYDAVKLLEEAIKKAETVDPAVVSETLRNLKDWSGVTGNHTFTSSGDVSNKPIVFKIIQKGKFTFLKEFINN
ncbi:ABC transporter substrate-binding protein [Deltaproteobacteria bacterium TL4]